MADLFSLFRNYWHAEGPQRTLQRVLRFLLAHHFDEEYDRCYRVGKVYLCARCVGLYPALFLMGMLEVSGIVTEVRLESLFLYVLPIPALLSWSRRQITGAAGSNPCATVTGALLGLSLGHGLFLHYTNPWNAAFLGQVGLITFWVLGTLFLGKKMGDGKRDKEHKDPSKQCRTSK